MAWEFLSLDPLTSPPSSFPELLIVHCLLEWFPLPFPFCFYLLIPFGQLTITFTVLLYNLYYSIQFLWLKNANSYIMLIETIEIQLSTTTILCVWCYKAFYYQIKPQYLKACAHSWTTEHWQRQLSLQTEKMRKFTLLYISPNYY